MKSRRAVLIEPGKFEIQEFDINAGKGQLLIEVYACGLCNWELNHWRGTFGTYPQGAGHEWCGIVRGVGEGVKDFKIGDRVTALPYASTPGFADYLVSDADKCFLIKDSVPLINAMAEPLKCVVTVLGGAAPEPGDYGAVVGCGPMGLWCIQGLRGGNISEIIAVDCDDAKLKLAKEFGATKLINPLKINAAEEIKAITKGHMADFVIEGTGNPAVLQSCCDYAAKRGRVLIMSSYDGKIFPLSFNEIIGKGLTIKAVHPPFCRDELEETRRTVELINNKVFDSENIVNYKFSLNDIQKAFETLENKPKDYIKGCVIPGGRV